MPYQLAAVLRESPFSTALSIEFVNQYFCTVLLFKEWRRTDMVYVAMRQYQMRNIGGIEAEHFNVAEIWEKLLPAPASIKTSSPEKSIR